ncbi:MAG: hypothetical protein M1816_006240 [Peltula sp. TS41687]|nr:MAG: hypothetical protein M1816_006240 [Peltula sp. TS41687]
MADSFTFRWEGQYNDERSERTFAYVDWNALLTEVQRLGETPDCTYEGPYHAGGRHIVRRLVFADEREPWLARIPIIPAKPPFGDEERSGWWTTERKFTMESEIATMKYIAETGKVPVPSIYGHKASVERNPVKLPYLLMQCIRGNMFYDLGGPSVLACEQRAKVQRSIALLQYQMATVSLSKLGSLVLKADGTVEIGPLPASFGFQGPFTSPAGFFISWAAHAKSASSAFLHDQFEDDLTLRDLKQAVISFPSRLKETMEQRPPSACETGYPIVHRDFLMHNILFDDAYNVVGVIDWEGAHSAPFEVFAALTNLYSCFDLKTVQAIPDGEEDGRSYIEDVMDQEMMMSGEPKLSAAFASILGDIGHWMISFEEGKIAPFTDVLDRYTTMSVTN